MGSRRPFSVSALQFPCEAHDGRSYKRQVNHVSHLQNVRKTLAAYRKAVGEVDRTAEEWIRTQTDRGPCLRQLEAARKMHRLFALCIRCNKRLYCNYKR